MLGNSLMLFCALRRFIERTHDLRKNVYILSGNVFTNQKLVLIFVVIIVKSFFYFFSIFVLLVCIHSGCFFSRLLFLSPCTFVFLLIAH